MSVLQIFRKPQISNLRFQRVGSAVGRFTQMSADIEGWGRMYVTTSFQPKQPDYSEASILLWKKFRATLRQIKAFLKLGHHELTLTVPQGSTIKVVAYNLFGYTAVSCRVPIKSSGSFSAAMPTDINANVESITHALKSAGLLAAIVVKAADNFSRHVTPNLSQSSLSAKSAVPSIQTKISTLQTNVIALSTSQHFIAQYFPIRYKSITQFKKEFNT